MTDASTRSSGRGRGSTALVTGASSGIGEAYARALAIEGWNLTIVARGRDALEALASELRDAHGVGVKVLAADLTAAEGLSAVEQELRSDPELELLVNNAGFGVEGPFLGEDIERQTAMIRLNVEALVRLTHAALGPMVERGRGAIVNVASGAAFAPMPFFSVYAATKAFVLSFTESLHEEIAGKGVRLQVLCPGFTRTRFQEVAGTDPDRIPGLLWQTPEQVVEASLAALKRGSLVCIPGLKNQALFAFRGPLSRTLTRKLLGVVGRATHG